MPAEQQITILEDIDTERIDLVKNPANGFPILMLKSVDPASKAVNAAGGVDEKPDIDGADQVLQLLAKLIQNEAAEMEIGNWDETSDIGLLTEAASLVKWFRAHEQSGDEDDGAMAKDIRSFVQKRKVNTAERKRLAAEGKALPDGSYPIENAEDLRNAAILARSGHGDTGAAKKLIARRAKELGVTNPLADDAKKDAEPEAPVTPAATSEPSGSQDEAQPDTAALMKEAITEANAPLKAEIDSLRGELAKVLATPLPGGPAFTAPPHMRAEAAKTEAMVKAAHFEQLADSVTEPDLKREYLARAAAAKA